MDHRTNRKRESSRETERKKEKLAINLPLKEIKENLVQFNKYNILPPPTHTHTIKEEERKRPHITALIVHLYYFSLAKELPFCGRNKKIIDDLATTNEWQRQEHMILLHATS